MTKQNKKFRMVAMCGCFDKLYRKEIEAKAARDQTGGMLFRWAKRPDGNGMMWVLVKE